MKPCKDCRIQPEKFYGQLDHEKKLFHVIRCPRCQKSAHSYKSINAVKLAWGVLNRQPEPYMILAELEAENNRLKELLSDCYNIFEDIHRNLDERNYKIVIELMNKISLLK